MSTSVSSAETKPKYTALIPVFNSAEILGKTIAQTVGFFEEEQLEYELVLVNDGSVDSSWQVICENAAKNDRIVGINLLQNYGQHTANLCGLDHSTGDYVITLDDDLQNPPAEIIHLIRKASEGHDVVFGVFQTKRHSLWRQLGSKMISALNTHIFRKPPGLTVSNFRILRRDVVDRICAQHGHYPYTTGLALSFSNNPANVTVDHHAREIGKSSYSLLRICRLVAVILFSYSSFPLRLMAGMGFAISAGSFLVAASYLIKNLAMGSAVPGWTTLIVLLSFFNGVTILMLSMLGEYVIRILNQISTSRPYEVAEKIQNGG
jgi:glycosyltransferase involved in cell wall biosynthesis